jgi:hypothetical protein
LHFAREQLRVFASSREPSGSLVSLFGLFCLASAAHAQTAVVSPRPDTVSVTLYREAGLTSRDLQTNPDAANQGLVMVTETRTVDLPAGAAGSPSAASPTA